MIRPLAALLAALAAAAFSFDSGPSALAQDKPAKPPVEDLPAEMKWELQKDDRFEFKWVYDESRKQVIGRGDSSETTDKRDVAGEIFFKENGNGTGGTIVLVVKKALYAVTSRNVVQLQVGGKSVVEHDISIVYTEGKKTDVQVKVQATGQLTTAAAKEGLQVTANQLAENMKKQVECAFTITPNFRKHETMIMANNAPAKPGPCLFDKIFMHSPLPTGSIKQGQTWKDPVDSFLMPTGLMEANTIDYKVPTVSATNILVKAGFQIPIVKPPTVTDQKVTGNYSIAREYNFHRAGYLQSSKEEVIFTKKVDASGADAAFYKEDSSASSKQQLTIKKKPATPKPEEKK